MDDVKTKKGKIYKDVTYYVPEAPKKPEKGKAAEIDEIDRKILNILIKDGRASFSDIGRELNIGVSTAFKRINDLLDKGIIKKATVLLDNERVGLNATAFISIVCEKKSKSNIIMELKRIDEIIEIHETLEQYDLIIKTRDFDIKNLKEKVLNRVLSVDGVLETSVSLVLKTHKEECYSRV